MTYTNPRREAFVLDWPYGKLKTTASFTVETNPRRGERTDRTTVDPKNGRVNKPKFSTYSKRQLIVDGDDGQTYVAELTEFGQIYIRQGNLQYQEEVAFLSTERYDELLELFA